MSRFISVGLTGGVACGKSAVAGTLARIGVPVIDADLLAHELLCPGSVTYDSILAEFGPGILDDEGAVNRRELGRVVFGNVDARKRLNDLMHPEVYRRLFAWIGCRVEEGASEALAVVPLLFETGMDHRFDRVIVVASDDYLVRDRLRARGLNEEEANMRIAAQWALSEKVQKASDVIWNNSDLASLETATLKVWNEILSGKEKTHERR